LEKKANIKELGKMAQNVGLVQNIDEGDFKGI